MFRITSAMVMCFAALLVMVSISPSRAEASHVVEISVLSLGSEDFEKDRAGLAVTGSSTHCHGHQAGEPAGRSTVTLHMVRPVLHPAADCGSRPSLTGYPPQRPPSS